MKSKKLLLILLIIICANKMVAQEKMHLITLEPETVLDADFYISEILDDRQIKENIGVAQKGLMNKQVPANFSEDFSAHLMNYFSAILPEKPSAEPLILKIHKLYISERTAAMSELGTCEVELEFLREENGKLYALDTYESKVEGKGADVTVKHDERIQEAIQNCIREFSDSDWKNKELAEAKPSDMEDKNVINQDFIPKKGLYMDFEDLLNNTPKQDIAYREKSIAQSKKTEHFQIFQPEKNKRIKNLFGYSDGKNIYLNASRYTQADYFIKSKLIGRYMYFEDQYSNPTAAASFGIMGAVVSIKYTGIVLDTKTGVTTVLNNKNMENILSGYPELLNEYNQTKKTVEDDRKMIEKINNLQKV